MVIWNFGILNQYFNSERIKSSITYSKFLVLSKQRLLIRYYLNKAVGQIFLQTK